MRRKTLVVRTTAQAREAYLLVTSMIKEMEYKETPDEALFVSALLSSANNASAIIAYECEKPVGIVHLSGFFVPYEAAMSGYCMALFVAPEFRRQGIGGTLFRSAYQEAQRRKFSGIFWQVHTDNLASIEFFKHHGFSSFQSARSVVNFYKNFAES